MHRKRPGRRMHGVRLPGTTAVLTLALVAGCTSSGDGTPSAPPAGTDQPSTAPESSSQTPVALPISPSPTPVERTLKRPPGATIVDLHTCGGPIGVLGIFIRNQIFAAPDVSAQLIQLAGAARLARGERRTVEKDRRIWLRDGYPASFPVVRELDTYIDVYTKIIAAARAKDLNPLPDLYLKFEEVDTQYASDTGPSVCEQ